MVARSVCTNKLCINWGLIEKEANIMLSETSFPLVNQNHSFYSHIPRTCTYKSPPTNLRNQVDESLHAIYKKKPFLFPSNTYHNSIFWLSNTCFILNYSTEMTGNLNQQFFLTENRPQICDKDVVIVFKIINVDSHKPFYFLKQLDLGKELLTWLKRNWSVLH
jgi:hypothetical protein